jgi:hypothetical protein
MPEKDTVSEIEMLDEPHAAATDMGFTDTSHTIRVVPAAKVGVASTR